MQISIEISLYPLTEDFVPPIGDFIHRLRQHEGLKVISNAMSTQVYGEYQKVTAAVGAEMELTHQNLDQGVFVMKVLKGDVSRPPGAVD